MKIIYIEDDIDILEPTLFGLKSLGLECTGIDDAEKGLREVKINVYDCILLDINFSKNNLNGFEILKEIRKQEIDMPVILISARDSISDKVKGLELGADDYIVKPFMFEELVARINTVVRRYSPNKKTSLAIKKGELFPKKNIFVTTDKREISLSNKETGMLEYLIRHKGEIISSEELLEKIWDSEIDPFTDTVKTHIKTLRNKIDPKKTAIKTVRGKGYILED